MTRILTLLISAFFFVHAAYAQKGSITFEEWQKESADNIRLLPRYGYVAKTPEQKQADEKFIEEVMAMDKSKSRREESDHMVSLGFQYLYRGDVRTAMYRFNQAYLLDSTTTEDYLGYGAVYMYFEQYELAEEQYKIGLEKDPRNAHLWTDYATIYLGKYYKGDATAIDTAIMYLNKSYEIDKTYASTVYKLSICYWIKEDCNQAKKYLNECIALKEELITEEYKSDLEKLCN